MTMTDPIADFLTRLRNANSAYHDEVTLPHSKIKAHIATILKEEGYITDFRTEDARVGKSLVVQLKYGPSRERSIAGLRRVSKPGLRVYARTANLGLRALLLISAFFAIWSVLLERKAEGTQQRSSFVVDRRRGDDGDVHATDPVDLVHVDLMEHRLLGQSEGVVAGTVELLG